jgi:hypothetical protein
MPEQNFRVQPVDDVQEFLSGRHEMTQGAETWGEVARALSQIYYCIDWHGWKNKGAGDERGVGGRGRKEGKTAVA